MTLAWAVEGRKREPIERRGAASEDAGRRLWLALAALIAGMVLISSNAVAQVCSSNQSQLTQAIADSQTALQRASGNLDTFGRALISPRAGPVDASNVISVRSNLDAFVSALSEFSNQVRQIGDACGPEFAVDAQTLSNIVSQFGAERTRADQMIGDHEALMSSGEPPMSQTEMEAVQRALLEQGFYQGGVDGRFGAGTRDAIGRFQQARGLQPTRYLTPDQIVQLTQAQPAPPPQGASDAQPSDGLPPAPPVGDSGPSLADTEAGQICARNTAEVENANERTRTFRQQVGPRITAFRSAVRGPRIPAIDAEAGAHIIADVNSYLAALEAFYQQAETVVGHCDDAFDETFQTLSGQLDALRGINQRVSSLNDDYAEMVESGEPAMSEETMKQVQTGLKALGHYSSAIDAVFGPGTRSAIRAYQESTGASQTGYLTANQIAALQQAAVAPVEPDPIPVEPQPTSPTPPTPPAATTAAPDGPAAQISDARSMLTRDLAERQVPVPLSQVRPGDGRFGDNWWQARDNLSRGLPQVTVDQRLSLFGAAYLDRGAESLSMVDAHLIIGDAFARLGLFGDAAFHLQRAYDLWSGLDRTAGDEKARLLERLAAARLAQAAGNGSVGSATFDDVNRMLIEALAASRQTGDGDTALSRLILGRLADLYAAAERQPEDADLLAAFRARYPG